MTAITFPMGNTLGYQQVGSAGTKAMQLAFEAGAPMAGAKGVDNLGVLIDAQKYGVRLRIARRVMGNTEACPGMDDHPTDETLRAMAATQVGSLVHNMNAEEKQAATHIEPWNEPKPSTPLGWTNLTKLMYFTCDAAEANGLKAVLLSLNCGGYEWADIGAVLDMHINGESLTARANRGGHRFAGHEGLLPPYPDKLDASLFGITLPGGPYLSAAGWLCMRWLFWRLAAKQRGQTLPPWDQTEFYPLIAPTASYVVNVPAGRTAYYDGLMSQYAEGGVTFLYGVGQTGVGLPRNDMSSIWPALVPYLVQVKNRKNATATAPVPDPVPVPVPTPTSSGHLVGLHMRSDGPNAPADFHAADVARVQAVKFTTGARPEDVTAALALNPSMLIVVRIFQKFDGRKITAADFVQWNAPDIERFYQQGLRLFEVHNEPNLYSEGYGTAWVSGVGFGTWFQDACAQLRALFPGIKLGWPGLSPGGDIAGVRANAQWFANEAGSLPLSADWVGQHVYWQNPAELTQQVPGQLDEYQKRYPGKPVYITEFSNQTGAPSQAKGQEYVQFYQMLAKRPAPPVAAFAFVSSASSDTPGQSGFPNEVWRKENGDITDIPAAVGARTDAPPATNQMRVINAVILNVRQFPWSGSVEPPKVRQLKSGDIVTVEAIYRSPTMAQGWASINPNSNEWVSAYYLGPV